MKVIMHLVKRFIPLWRKGYLHKQRRRREYTWHQGRNGHQNWKQWIFFHLSFSRFYSVKKGQKPGKGQLIGCGNSGNSSGAHISFLIQNGVAGAGTSGVKAYFEELKVNGGPKTDYFPVKGDRIQSQWFADRSEKFFSYRPTAKS